MMNKLTGVMALCLVTSTAFAKTLPCEGAEGNFRTNPNSTPGGFVALTASVAPEVITSVDSQVCDFATLKGQAVIEDRASVSGRAVVTGRVQISGDAKVYGDASLINSDFGSNMVVKDNAQIFGNAYLRGKLLIADTSVVYGGAVIQGFVELHGASRVCAGSVLNDVMVLTDNTIYCPTKKF